MEYVDFIVRFPVPDNPTDDDIVEAKARLVTALVVAGAPEELQAGILEDGIEFSADFDVEDGGKLH